MIKVSNEVLLNGEVYVPGLSREYVAEKYGVPLDDVAKLGSAENPHGASPKAIEAVKWAESRLDIYPDWTASALREAIGRRLGFDADNVVCGCGETEIISMVIRAFAGPDDPVLMHQPCFPIYRIYCNNEGRRPVFSKMGADFDPRTDEYIENLRQAPRIAFVTNPHNPSGRMIPEDALRSICDAAPPTTLLVFDEAYIHYTQTEGGIHLLRDYDNLLVLRTMSKAYGLAGLRIGFAVANNPALIAPLRNLKPTWNMGQAQIAGGAAAIFDDEHVQRAVATVSEMRDYVSERLREFNRFRMVPGSRANFFLVEILDSNLTSSAVFEELLKRGVIVKNGNDIPGLGDRYLRVDVNLKKHMDRFIGSLREIELLL
jgi:histidinol-phosphate aminotransferase